ncbi:unnamed protein product [Rotaria magnacalcarata]
MSYASDASVGTVAVGSNGFGTSYTQLEYPVGLYFDSLTNSLVVANSAAHNIVRWILSDNSWTQVAGISGIQGNSSSLLNLPMGVTFDPMGNMIHFALLDCQYRRRFRSRTSAMSIVLILFCVLMNAVNGQNCSVYNPCGRNGYCTYEDEEPICECKFWWIGTFCNELTNSGKQVIILGSLLGVLIITFHSLNIFHLYRQRKRQPKKATKKVQSNDPTILDIAVGQMKRSAGVTSCIIAVLIVLVAGGTLVAKWSLLQPIHTELVNRYNNDSPLYYESNSICKKIQMQRFNILTFPVACFIILIFILITKRTSLLRKQCPRGIAPPMPVDFLSRIDRKFAAVIFAMCADELFTIVKSIFESASSNSNDSGVIISYLERIFQVLIIGFRYYPLLAAVYLDSIVSLVCGTLYSWLDYSITIVNQGLCNTDFYVTLDQYISAGNESSLAARFDYYGTGSTLLAIQLCTDIPRYLCLAYVSIKLPFLLIDKIRQRLKRSSMSDKERMMLKLTREERILLRISDPDSPDMLYVRNLFRQTDQRPRSHHLIARLLPKFIYEWRDDFTFSTRILCIYSSIILLLFFITVQACVIILPKLNSFQKSLQSTIDLFSTSSEDGNDDQPVDPATTQFPVPSLQRVYILAVVTTVLLITIQLLTLLANIRRNLFQAFRGDDSEIPRRQRSRYISYSAGNIHFGGYCIGYLIWGFILLAFFAIILWTCVEAFINFSSVRLIETLLKSIIPSLLFIYFKQYLNKLLARYVFLQHGGQVLAINNRRILMIFIYFSLFLDAFLGFISSITRLLLSVFYGIIYMCRLDYSPLGRKLELMDGGFSAYCGYIHTECCHRHPVMLIFASHLFTQFKMNQYKQIEHLGQLSDPDRLMYAQRQKKSLRAIRKWNLGVFLIRNPMIAFFRKAYLKQLDVDDLHALTDLDGDANNRNQRLAIYHRRGSVAGLSVIEETNAELHKQQRF